MLHVRLTKAPKYVRAEERVSEVTIPGRHGSLFQLEGDAPVYQRIELTAELVLMEGADMRTVRAWLSGAGDLVFSRDPAYCYRARAVKQMEFEQVMRGRSLQRVEVAFKCEPFQYLTTPGLINITTATHTLYNPGTVEAAPVITVYGSGDIGLVIGGTPLTLMGVSGGSITLDCAARIAYTGTTLQNHKVLGSWPVLAVGANSIVRTGSVSRIDIVPNWRWL